MLGKRYLRVNHTGGGGRAFTEMDVANDDTRGELLNAGVAVADKAYGRHRAFIDRFLSPDRKRMGTRTWLQSFPLAFSGAARVVQRLPFAPPGAST